MFGSRVSGRNNRRNGARSCRMRKGKAMLQTAVSRLLEVLCWARIEYLYSQSVVDRPPSAATRPVMATSKRHLA